jgi:hypothetical protein
VDDHADLQRGANGMQAHLVAGGLVHAQDLAEEAVLVRSVDEAADAHLLVHEAGGGGSRVPGAGLLERVREVEGVELVAHHMHVGDAHGQPTSHDPPVTVSVNRGVTSSD